MHRQFINATVSYLNVIAERWSLKMAGFNRAIDQRLEIRDDDLTPWIKCPVPQGLHLLTRITYYLQTGQRNSKRARQHGQVLKHGDVAVVIYELKSRTVHQEIEIGTSPAHNEISDIQQIESAVIEFQH